MPNANKSIRILISHSLKDEPIAGELYVQLRAEDWMDLWFIESNLLPSQNWDLEIRQAVEQANIVITLLSKNIARREAFFYPDPYFVVDLLKTKQKSKTLLIPMLLDSSDVPVSLQKWEAINYFPKSQRTLAYRQLLERVRIYAEQHGYSIDTKVQDVMPEPGFQWSPKIWKEQSGVAEEVIDDESFERKRINVPSQLKKRIFNRGNNLFYTALTVFVAIGYFLTINYFVRGNIIDPILAPTFVSIPESTLGVGSTRVSSVDEMKMMYIPAGEFIMGGDVYFEEKPIHSVILDAFWIDQTEVTNAMFTVFLNQWGNRDEDGVVWLDAKDEDVRIRFEEGFWRTSQAYEDHPVVEVTWYGANAYCSWAGRHLPTEAEWEKAARGITGNIFPWGNKDSTSDLLNFDNNFGDTRKVGSYPNGASPYSALDMAGNVLEWVADRYSRTYYSDSPLENPSGPDKGFFRVLRGGGWNSRDTYVRSIHRNSGAPTISHDFVGFRCAFSE